MVALVSERKNVFSDLLTVMTHDYSTFSHIMNTCTCCVALAEAYGVRDRTSLSEIGQGALLHDVGKRYISAKLLNKTTPLTKDEQDLIRQHPARGFEELCLRGDLNWGQLMMIYQHHERCDGRGYPTGVVGNDIHEWARLCSVADVHDAITRDRAYHKGASTREAMEYMEREAGHSFDKEISQCWIAALNSAARSPDRAAALLRGAVCRLGGQARAHGTGSHVSRL